MSNETNATLAYLEANFPSYLDLVPKELLVFPILSESCGLFISLFITILSGISLSGNFLMIFLFFR